MASELPNLIDVVRKERAGRAERVEKAERMKREHKLNSVKNGKGPQKPSRESLYDSIIYVKIGPDQVNFEIHKALLCQQPGYFRRVLSSGMKEAVEGIIYLDEDDPAVFSLFMVWLYTGSLLTDDEVHEKKQIWPNLVGLGIFAELRGIPNLHDAVISGMVRTHELLGSLPSETIVQQTWDNTPDNSLLRAFLCRLFAWKVDMSTYLTSERLDVLSKEFLAGVTRELYDCITLFRLSGPLERCRYHHHDSGSCQDPKDILFKSRLPIYRGRIDQKQ